MSDLTQTIQRVLDLDKQATPGPWVPWLVKDRDEDDTLWIATSSCHNADEAQVRKDAALIAEYRTAAPDLARALVAEQGRVADLERQLAALREHGLGNAAAIVKQARDAESERDEAQKERDAARGEVAELLAHADADALMLTQVARERDAAIRERDEARARWDGYETARELECQGLRKERDEARAERDAAAVVCDRAAAAITGVIRGQITGAESTLIADLTHVARLHAARVVGITPPWHPEVARLQADLNEARAARDKAVAEEREACAEVAESVTTRIAPNRQEPITELDVICIANGRGETIAAAIRARGTR